MTNIFDRLTVKLEGAQAVDAADVEAPDAGTTASPEISESRDLDRESASEDAHPCTPRQVKDVALELLKYGLLEEQRKPNLYRAAIVEREAIGRVFEPLDLAMRVDEIRGLAYVIVAGSVVEGVEGEWSHPLVRRQRLNLEQSLLIAILRQQFVAYEQQAGIGSSEAMVAIEDILPQLHVYLGDLGSDALEEKRLRQLIEQLKVHGIVSEPDEHGRFAIRPIIAHLASPENLQGLLAAFRREASGNP